MEANYGILALIPPVVAIGLCFATKQVLISMFAGLFAGALVISNWNPFAELLELFEKYGYTLEGKKRIADELHISLRTLYRRISHLKEELSKN